MADNDGTNTGAGGGDPAATVAAQSAAPDVEGRARRMGWRPKEEFRGDQNRWTDAETFIARGEQELPILRDRYRALDDKFVRQGEQINELTTRLSEVGTAFKEFRTFATNAEKRSYERAKAEIQAKMSAAVSVADSAAFVNAQREMDALGPPPAELPKEEPKAAPVAPAVPRIEPEVTRWVNDPANSWYHTDSRMRAVATAIHGDLLQSDPSLSMRENLAEVRRQITELFPDRFTNVRRQEAAAVAPPQNSGGAPRSGQRTFDGLPAEAKAAYAKFAKEMPGYTQKEYLDVYYAGEEA